MIKYAKTLAILCFAFGAFGLIIGFLGGYHPAADSVAVFRPYAIGALFFATFAFALWRQRFLTLLSLALAVYGGVSLRHQLIAPTPVAGFSLLQQNSLFQNDARDLVEYALANAPDVITLQEVTTHAIPQLAALRPQYPYQVICPFSAKGGVAILSKFRFTTPQGEGCIEGLGVVHSRIEIPGGEVTVVSLHLQWPWPYEQAAQLQQLLPELEKLTGPIFIAGDFNMVPWSRIMANIEAATGTQTIGGLRFTKSLLGGFVQLPIDHVLAPKGWPVYAALGPRLGSDHNSVLAQFSLN